MQRIDQNDCDDFVRRFWSANDDLPKHEKLRKAISTAIIQGYWRPGARLATESEWVSATPCGLATVQSAFRALVADGLVHRRRGSGTVVARLSRPLSEGPWHMRFLRQLAGESEYLPVSTRVLNRNVMQESGPWADILGGDEHALVRIERIMEIDDAFSVYNVFYAQADRFPELVHQPMSELHGTNIKKFISQRYHMAVHKVRHQLRFGPVPEWVKDNCKWPDTSQAVIFNAVAYSLGKR
jgi:DNA-binding GntR family transcriptional regulator